MKLDSDPLNLPLPNSAPVAIVEPPPESPGTASASANASSELPSERKSRRTGKIARLPKKLRDLINELLSDGLTYSQVLQHLHESTDPPLPYEISERNISGWHTGGYQDWLHHQDRLELLGHKLDFAFDLARNSQPDQLQELCLQLAAVRMCEFLSELAIADPQTDPNIYLRLLSAVPRISKETLNLQKYRDASAKAQSADTTQPGSEADHAEACRTALLNRMDDIMGLKSYRHRPTLLPPSPPAPSPPQSRIENQDSKIPSPETHGNLQKPNSNSAALTSPSEISNLESEIPVAPPQSKIENQNSKILTPETPGNLQKPNSNSADPTSPFEISNLESEIPAPPPQSKIENQNSQIPSELCLECAHPLPALLPNGQRPAKACPYCNFPLPPPGSCREPSIEQCPLCHANLPRSLPDGQRPYHYCHNCSTPLPALTTTE